VRVWPIAALHEGHRWGDLPEIDGLRQVRAYY